MSQRPTPDQPEPSEIDQTLDYKPAESDLETAGTIRNDPESERLAATIKDAGNAAGESRSRADLPADGRFGRYEIRRELGRGAMGAVYLARDSHLDRQVAIKIPQFGPDHRPEEVERFYREARAMATLSHPHLCPVYDVGQIDEVHYLTMQFVEGLTMDELLRGGTSHPAMQVAAVMRKLAAALEEAHQAGVIHRDLKPANIMLNKRNEPVIMDFGLAQRRKENETTLTRAGQIMGTPSYMSPEQVKGKHDQIGPPSDVYSLGVICYQLLTGKLPFTGSLGEVMAAILTEEPQPPSTVNKQVDRSMEAICLKAMAKNINERYGSASELADALRDYLRGKWLPEAAALSKSAAQSATPTTGSTNKTGREANLADDFFADLVAAKSQKEASSARSKPVPPWGWASLGGGVLLLLVIAIVVASSRGKDSESGGSQAAESTDDTDESKDVPADEPNTRGSIPLLAVAPFEAGQARAHQKAWAQHLGVEVEYTNSIGMEFRLIPPGEFTTGTPQETAERLMTDGKSEGDVYPAPNWIMMETPPKPASIEHAFFFGTTEVTQAEYKRVTGKNPSKWKNDNLPVETVSSADAAEYCNKLSDLEQRSRCYQIGADQITIVDGNGYRLPEQYEWEFACRAGTTTGYFFGDAPTRLSDFAWFKDNSGGRTHPVRSKLPNPFGLYDILGNVDEFYNVRHRGDGSGGGNFRAKARYARCASTYHQGVDFQKHEGLGFRVVLPIASAAEGPTGE